MHPDRDAPELSKWLRFSCGGASFPKTTTIRMGPLTFLIPILESVLISESNLLHPSASYRRETSMIGIVPQGVKLDVFRNSKQKVVANVHWHKSDGLLRLHDKSQSKKQRMI